MLCFSERSAVAVDAAGTGGAETGAAAVIAAVATGTADAAGWGHSALWKCKIRDPLEMFVRFRLLA